MNRRMLGCLFELLETLLLTLIFFFVVQLFVAQPYQVQQESMENTLMPDQYVLVDKLTPHFGGYSRGDVVVFNPPAGWIQDPNGTPYIKRVIGVGGDTVDIHGGHVFVNGAEISEPYLFQGQLTQLPGGGSNTWTLDPNELFVMGDHRQVSQDSRDFGPIDRSTVIGRAWIRYWPLSSSASCRRSSERQARADHRRPARPDDWPARRHRRRHERPMIELATVAALAVAAGAAVAVSTRDRRAVALGLAVATAAAPFAASPLPSALSLAARIVGALLGAYLLWAAARAREIRIEGSAIGLAAEAAIAAAAFVVGLWIAPVKPLPGPVTEQAAGLALVALAVVPLIGRDVMRVGVGATLLGLGLLLLRAAWLGPGLPLEHLAQAALLVGILGATSLLMAPPEVAADAELIGATQAETMEGGVADAAAAALPPLPSLRAGSTVKRTRHARAGELRR